MWYEWTCIIETHDLKYILLEGMSNMRTGFIGWHVMQGDMYYWKTYGSGGHVFHENVLVEDMSRKWA